MVHLLQIIGPYLRSRRHPAEDRAFVHALHGLMVQGT